MTVVVRKGNKRTVVATGLDEWEAEDLAEYYEWFLLEGNWHADIEEE